MMGLLRASVSRRCSRHLFTSAHWSGPSVICRGDGHGNKVPGGPSSEELAVLFEAIFRRYPTASAIGFATIPPTDEGGLSLAAVNRMIAGAVRGVRARQPGR